MSTCLIIQHIEPESSFTIDDALEAAGVVVETCRVFAGDAVPDDTSLFNGLVVMGGPMSASSDEGFPTRPSEIHLLAEALRLGTPTLGICLGAQLLAVAAGADAYRGETGPEIGWAPVELSDACDHDLLFMGLPESLTVLHWHGDTFELPAGAELLASNTAYRHQAFRLGAAAWGLQFHLEVTKKAVDGFLAAFGPEAELVEGGSAEIAAATAGTLASLEAPRALVLERFATLVATFKT